MRRGSEVRSASRRADGVHTELGTYPGFTGNANTFLAKTAALSIDFLTASLGTRCFDSFLRQRKRKGGVSVPIQCAPL